jgi:hypothetical protein
MHYPPFLHGGSHTAGRRRKKSSIIKNFLQGHATKCLSLKKKISTFSLIWGVLYSKVWKLNFKGPKRIFSYKTRDCSSVCDLKGKKEVILPVKFSYQSVKSLFSNQVDIQYVDIYSSHLLCFVANSQQKHVFLVVEVFDWAQNLTVSENRKLTILTLQKTDVKYVKCLHLKLLARSIFHITTLRILAVI